MLATEHAQRRIQRAIRVLQAITAKSGCRINISKDAEGEWTSIEVEGGGPALQSVKMQIEKIVGYKPA